MDTILQIAFFIAGFEGFSHAPYFDRNQYTVGYGTRSTEQICITEKEAISQLMDIVARHAKRIQAKYEVNTNELIALTSLSYNLGQTAFRKSSVVKNLKNKPLAAKNFEKYRFSNGKPLSGLIIRRAAERKMFSTPITQCHENMR